MPDIDDVHPMNVFRMRSIVVNKLVKLLFEEFEAGEEPTWPRLRARAKSEKEGRK